MPDRKFYEKYSCPNCNKKLESCQRELRHCPFCVAVFDSTLDWNNHIDEKHQEFLK